MDLSEQNILFFPRTMGLGGTEKVVLQLCEILKPRVKNVIVCSCGGENVKCLNELGIQHYMIPDIESKSPFVMFKTARQICKIVRKENITLIHTHHRMAAFYITILRLYKKCSFFNTSHGIFFDKRYFTKLALSHAQIIACGNTVKNNLIDFYNLPSDKICVIQNAVSPFDGAFQRDETIYELHKKGCFIVGNISRLSQEKGVDYFIRSLPKVIERYPQTHYLIIGSGKDEQMLRNLVKDLKVEDNIHFLGYRTNIQNLISQIDLIVLSSLTEGLPLTPMEAFSVGKSVVATAVGGTVDIIDDGRTGFLIEAKKPDQIAEKIIWMIEHPEEKKSMEHEAKKQYNQRFSIEKMTYKYLEFYGRSSI